MKLTRYVVGVGALIAGLSAVDVGGRTVQAAEGGTDRPFAAAGTGTGVFEPIEECDLVITARGPALECDQVLELDFVATHLGASTYSSAGVLVLYIAEQCVTPSGGPGVPFKSSQVGAIVVANGDALTTENSVSGCGDGETLSEPAGTYTITGGTGRFAGAFGTGTVEAVALGTSLSNKWVGTISY